MKRKWNSNFMLNDNNYEFIDENTRIMFRHYAINAKRAQDILQWERKQSQDWAEHFFNMAYFSFARIHKFKSIYLSSTTYFLLPSCWTSLSLFPIFCCSSGWAFPFHLLWQLQSHPRLSTEHTQWLHMSIANDHFPFCLPATNSHHSIPCFKSLLYWISSA